LHPPALAPHFKGGPWGSDSLIAEEDLMPTPQRIVPILVYEDIAAGHDFLVKAFGFVSGGIERRRCVLPPCDVDARARGRVDRTAWVAVSTGAA